MGSIILGCANSLIAHSIYADFLEDSGIDTSFFRIFLQMRRNGYYEAIADSYGDGFDPDYGGGFHSYSNGDGISCPIYRYEQ